MKDDLKRIAIRQDIYDELKAMAVLNHCSLADVLKEVASKVNPNAVGNIYTKIERIETHLKQQDEYNQRLYAILANVNVSKEPGVFQPMVPLHRSVHPYRTDADIQAENVAMDERLKLRDEDFLEFKKAVAAGDVNPEDFVDFDKALAEGRIPVRKSRRPIETSE